MSNKGYQGKSESFAKGGPVLGRTTDFLKTEDRFTGRKAPAPPKNDEDWGSKKSEPKGKDKSLKAVKPRS